MADDTHLPTWSDADPGQIAVADGWVWIRGDNEWTQVATAEEWIAAADAKLRRTPATTGPQLVALRHYAHKLLGRELRRNPTADRDSALVDLNRLLGEPYQIAPSSSLGENKKGAGDR